MMVSCRHVYQQACPQPPSVTLITLLCYWSQGLVLGRHQCTPLWVCLCEYSPGSQAMCWGGAEWESTHFPVSLASFPPCWEDNQSLFSLRSLRQPSLARRKGVHILAWCSEEVLFLIFTIFF